MTAARPRSLVALPPQSHPLGGLGAECISALHWEALSRPHWPRHADPVAPDTPRHWVVENHRCNALLWLCDEQVPHSRLREEAAPHDLEDCSLRRKQAIDALDSALVEAAGRVELRAGARPSTGQAGALIDCLSINALRIFHLGLRRQRPEAQEVELVAGADQLAQWRLQRAALMQELDALLWGIVQGEMSYHPQRQLAADAQALPDPRASRSASAS